MKQISMTDIDDMTNRICVYKLNCKGTRDTKIYF